MDCQDKTTGKPVHVIVAMGWDPKTHEYIMSPLAKLFDGDPYEELIPPGYDLEEKKQ